MTLDEKIDEILSMVRAMRASTPARATITTGTVADDTDLDSQWGDEELKYQLSDKWWKGGGDYAGQCMSQCPADYLDAVAKANDAQAFEKNKTGDPDEIKKAGYKARTAARARGWAARVRAGKVPAKSAQAWDDKNPLF